MRVLFQLCVALSVGLILGFVGGGIKVSLKREYTQKQIDKAARVKRGIGTALKYVTFLLLLVGLVWSVYYLVLGLIDPAQAEYATSISQLIVSVLTIISIIFAFFEFLRR